MKKYYNPFRDKKLLILLLVVLAAFLVIFRFRQITKPNSIPNESAVKEYKATLAISDGTGGQTFNIPQFINKTALEATEGVAKTVTSGTGRDAFVTAINGKAADSKKREFWELLINGKPASVGAGTYIVVDGDSIKWHIATY